MRFSLVTVALCLMISGNLMADSIAKENQSTENQYHLSLKRAALPVSLIAIGFIATENDYLKRIDFSLQKDIHALGKTKIDMGLVFVPGFSAMILNASGVPAAHSLCDGSLILAGSLLTQAVVVQSLKYSTNIMRPDSSNRRSFPSMHTSVAFAGAEFLRQEYKHRSMWYGIGGYMMAGAVGVARIMNNKHRVSDVIAGAGIGILSTQLAYYSIKRIKSKKRKNGSFALINPHFGMNRANIQFTIIF